MLRLSLMLFDFFYHPLCDDPYCLCSIDACKLYFHNICKFKLILIDV